MRAVLGLSEVTIRKIRDCLFDREQVYESDGAKRGRVTSANDKRVNITRGVLMGLEGHIDAKHKRSVRFFRMDLQKIL